LSDPALAVLSEMATIRMSDFVFPGQRGQLSHRMLQLALTRIRSDVTVHGFRSSFRDWAGNETHASRDFANRRSAMSSATQPSRLTADQTRSSKGEC